MADAKEIISVIAIAATCALVLAATDRLTRDAITHNRSAADRAMLASLLPVVPGSSMPLPDLSLNPALFRSCRGLLLGRSNADGYGGPIRLLYSIDDHRKPAVLAGLVLLGHQETPGITDFLLNSAWTDALTGRSAEEFAGIDAVSGATITSQAITRTLTAALSDPGRYHGEAIAMDCGS